MIAQLTGRVVQLSATEVVLEVAGVGFLVAATPGTTAGLRLGEQATLHTHLVVREDALTLYGFASPAERAGFVTVQAVSGIGPRLALAIVSHLTPAQLRQALLTENLAALSTVPGVGRKTAQRLVLELKDKALGLPGDDTGPGPASAGWQEQVVQGLIGLGYSAKDAEAAWQAVQPLAEAEPAAAVSTLMRAALRSLARG
jgi:Holliday junction DNA helicase RuvA